MESEQSKLALDLHDLCGLLQTVGFIILDDDEPQSVATSGRSIQIKCNVSGKTVNLKSGEEGCHCWKHGEKKDVEKWEMSGTSGGVQVTKMESKPASFRELPKNLGYYIGKTIRSLVDIVRGSSREPEKALPKKGVKKSCAFESIGAKLSRIRNDCNLNTNDDLSISFTKDNSSFSDIKNDDPTSRYRSLDTLTAIDGNGVLPNPGVLSAGKKKNLVSRQNTYTTSPTFELSAAQDILKTRTSSPVPVVVNVTLTKINEAEKLSENLMELIKEAKKFLEDDQMYNNTSPSGSVMDMSKISQPRERRRNSIGHTSSLSTRTGMPYASSPNLSRVQESRISNNNLRRIRSISTTKISSPNFAIRGETLRPDSLKSNVPKRLSTASSLGQNLSAKAKKSVISINQVSGTYKPLTERMSLGSAGLPKSTDTKRKSSLYSHVKPTIQRQSTSKK